MIHLDELYYDDFIILINYFNQSIYDFLSILDNNRIEKKKYLVSYLETQQESKKERRISQSV
jgi:hypothetical protein